MNQAGNEFPIVDTLGPKGFRPGRLWSLWDMLTHDAAAFYLATGSIAMTRMTLGANKHIKRPLREPELAPIRSYLKEVLAHLPTGSEFARMAIERLLQIAENEISFDELDERLREIEGRLLDCLQLSYFLSLSPAEASLYEPKQPLFGDVFIERFPSVEFEVDEASKCLALSRATASAFHSIRCLEAGITAMFRCLGIPDPTKAHERSWKKTLDQIKQGVDAKWPSNAQRMKDDGRFFDEAYAVLAAIQNPWRNATMHLDQKYTDEEAGVIFNAVKGFMKKLASRMDENGKPPA